jgi:hypothetical protein
MNLDSIKSLLEEEDVANITAAISAGGKIWENELIDGFKAKFKAHYRTMLNE